MVNCHCTSMQGGQLPSRPTTQPLIQNQKSCTRRQIFSPKILKISTMIRRKGLLSDRSMGRDPPPPWRLVKGIPPCPPPTITAYPPRGGDRTSMAHMFIRMWLRFMLQLTKLHPTTTSSISSLQRPTTPPFRHPRQDYPRIRRRGQPWIADLVAPPTCTNMIKKKICTNRTCHKMVVMRLCSNVL